MDMLIPAPPAWATAARTAPLCSPSLAPRNLAAPHEWAAGTASPTPTAQPAQHAPRPAPLPVAEAIELPADQGWAQWQQALASQVHA